MRRLRTAEETHAINVVPLLQEAIVEAVRRCVVPPDEPLAGLIMELVVGASSAPSMLPIPRDVKAVRVAKRLIRDPARHETLDEMAHGAGAGVRTLERIFTSETGMDFAAWRQRLRMLESMWRLLDGDSVAAAAEAVGYESVSEFVVPFKATMGETPGSGLVSEGAQCGRLLEQRWR